MVNRENNVIVTNYDENWVQLFKNEAEIIREIFKDEIVEIHHIGRTNEVFYLDKFHLGVFEYSFGKCNIDMNNDC